MITNEKANRLQRGQALVLIILAIAGIFGFAAIAIDLGQIYMNRRASQAAADAAAMAAAFDAVGGSMDRDAAISKAFEMAATNGYNNDETTNWVTVNNPPVGGPYCGVCGSPEAHEYYQVRITVQMNPIFAHFVYNGEQQTTVEAIAHAKDISSLSAGDAILALSKKDDSLVFDGTTSVDVDGGNIRTLGQMDKKGASGGIVVTNDGGVYYGTTFQGHTSPFSPKPKKDAAGDMASFTPPYCPSTAELADGTWSSVKSGKTVLYQTKEINGVDYFYYPEGLTVQNLPPGIHCIQADKKGVAIDKGNYTGSGVILVLLSGGVKQTGGDSLRFRAPLDIEDANGNHFGGMVLYAPLTNTSDFDLGGNSDAYWQGTVFAPGAHCNLGGTSDGVGYHASFICHTIKIHGNPKFIVDYRAEENFRMPPLVELTQ